MTEDPIPVLVAVLVCDVAIADPNSSKNNLIGIFDNIYVVNFPAQRTVSLYIKLADVHGKYKIVIRYVQSKTGKTLAEVKGELLAKDPFSSANAAVEFQGLPIPEIGKYEFQVFANEIFLGSTHVEVLSVPPITKG